MLKRVTNLRSLRHCFRVPKIIKAFSEKHITDIVAIVDSIVSDLTGLETKPRPTITVVFQMRA